MSITIDEPDSAAAGPLRAGRPRDASRDTAILEAALDLIAEVGYDRVSMDAVAARARASKATIYRRWDGKAALVAAAVQCRAAVDLDFPDTGSLRGDLVAALSVMGAAMETQDLALMTGLFAAMRSDPELAETMRTCMFSEKLAAIQAVFDRATARGERTTARAAELLEEVAPAVLINRLMVVNAPIDAGFVAHLVDDILLPILTWNTLAPLEGPSS